MTWAKVVLCASLLLTCSVSNTAGSAEDREQAFQSLLAEAGQAQARGDFATAADAYRKSVALDPSIPELWANLGLMYHQLGKRPEAIQSFKKAIQLKPALFVPQLFLGIEYLAEQKPNLAVPHLKLAAELNPKDMQAALSLGRAFSMLNRGREATEAYWTATQLTPNDGNAWIALGTSYLQQVENDARLMNSTYKNSSYVDLRAAETFTEEGKFIDAETAFKAALSVMPQIQCAHVQYGIMLLRARRLTDALQQFKLEKQGPDSCGLTPLAIAVADLAQGKIDAGLDELSSIVASDPDFARSNLALFRDALSSKQMQLLSDAIQARQSSGSLSADVGKIISPAFTSGNAPSSEVTGGAEPKGPEAAGEFSACEKRLKAASGALSLARQRTLASCAFYSGHFRTAARAAQALIVSPTSVVEGLYWESKADQRMAVAALTRAEEIEPNSPQMRVLIGDVFRQKRRWSEAETEYRKAIDLDPKSRSARLSLAIVLFTELKSDEAFEIDKSLLAEEPDDPEANLLAGEILVQQHEYKQAEPYLAKCGKITAEYQPRLHVLLGEVYAETDRIHEAIGEFKQGLSTDQDGSIHYQLARLYQKTGNAAAASEQIRISKQLRERWDNEAHVAMKQRATDVSRQ